MSQTLSLYRLQQIDSHIERAQARLAIIAQELENDQQLRLAGQAAQDAETAHQSAGRALRKAEADVEAQRIKIEQIEASLYGGAVRHPKELQDLQNDAAALKRHLTTLEDRLLEAMLAAETAEASSQAASGNAQAQREHRMTQDQGLRQEQETLQREIERLKTEHGAVVGNIPQEAISLYDKLRQERRGVAVSAVSDSSCGACGSTLTMAQIQAARSGGEVAFCPSCGRILYAS